ncbi:MAG: hypothetical protein IAF38_05910 [Bacteroidia bacterium]|nr:hypothetical protein [Bacteroidia bacterium]
MPSFKNIWFSIAACLVIVGVLCKIMHWPGAIWFLSSGVLLSVIDWAVAFFKKQK